MDSYYLSHYGVPGMKWGVRKDPEKIYGKTKYGENIYLQRNQSGQILGKVSKKIKEEQNKTYNYKVKNKNHKTVGQIQLYKTSPKEVNIVWGSTKKKYKNKGYMQAALELSERKIKDLGANKVTAELVGSSPDIHHIAEKYGYKKVGEIHNDYVDAVWGGLTPVEKRLD